jgi:hypothetical protein
MENYKEKIKKLLALSESPNEHEAKEALLKAKQLMMEHKVVESDLVDKKEMDVKKVKSTIMYSTRRDPWVPLLAGILAQNYLCKVVMLRDQGKQTKTVSFWGLADDVEICTKIFEYAVDCIQSECKRIKKLNADCTVLTRNAMCNGYAVGFISGLDAAFKEQEESNKAKWGVVPKMSENVAHSTDGLKRCRSSSLKMTKTYENAGYSAGKSFNMRNRVATS